MATSEKTTVAAVVVTAEASTKPKAKFMNSSVGHKKGVW